MAIVLDASIALTWYFEDEASEAAYRVLERVEEEGACVPAIWPMETANGLLMAIRRKRLDPGKLPAIAEHLAALPVIVESVSTVEALGRILSLAREHDLSVYDASYLDLALRKRAPLATRDERLTRASKASGLPIA